MEIIYLDCCCLNRPFNDQTQERIRREAEAILEIIGRCWTGEWTWIASVVLYVEIAQILDSNLRAKLEELGGFAWSTIAVDESIDSRADALESLGFHRLDALHLAVAEHGGATVLLTVDDRLLKRAKRLASRLGLRVENPVVWIAEQKHERK